MSYQHTYKFFGVGDTYAEIQFNYSCSFHRLVVAYRLRPKLSIALFQKENGQKAIVLVHVMLYDLMAVLIKKVRFSCSPYFATCFLCVAI